MTPIRLTTSWYRRLYVTIFLTSLVFAGLYAVEYTGILAIPATLHLPLIGAAASGVVAIAAVVLAVLAKKITSFVPSVALYLAFTLAIAFIVQQSGGVESPYVAFWVLAVFFAPVFGAYGWVPIIALIGGYAAGVYIGGQVTVQTSILLFLSSVVPLVGGLIVWRAQSESDEHTAKNVKNLASQLSEVATKSEIVINAIGDGVIAVDGKGVIQLINPAGQEILGWGKQDALMLSYKSILKLTDANNAELDASQDPIQQVLNTNQQARTNKLNALTQSGKKLSIAVVVSPIGELGSGAIAVFRDITNERAEEREQAEFISTASHEMRTPVASIEGYLGLALNPATATVDSRAHDYIIKAHEAAQHLGRLFQDLLDVSKSEDGRMSNIPRVVDITAFTETITQGLQQKATEKGLTLTFVPAGSDTVKKIMPVYYVNQDNDHVREVLDNLIENAIKYTPKGTVSVDVTGDDDKIIVSIKDSGLGIPPEDLPHLFQKFYRVDNIDRQQIGGTGLGLYLSRRLVEAMQGRLWVESVFGQGSTFFVQLPRIATQEATALKAQQEQQAQAAAQAAQHTAPQLIAPAPVQPSAPTPAAPAVVSQPVALTQPAAASSAPQTAPAPLTIPVRQGDAAPAARPATTVPRGESLTREQIAERVRQLEEMAKQQRENNSARQ